MFRFISKLDEPEMIGEVKTLEKENEVVENSDSEHESESEEETETEDKFQDLEVVTDSELYVITVNDEPSCYVKNQKEAEDCMWYIAKRTCKLYPDSKISYTMINDNELLVERRSNTILIYYDQPVLHLRYDKVKQIRIV